VLLLNGTYPQLLTQNAANGGEDFFTIGNPATIVTLPVGVSYAVTVGTQPSGQTCVVANGSGISAPGHSGGSRYVRQLPVQRHVVQPQTGELSNQRFRAAAAVGTPGSGILVGCGSQSLVIRRPEHRSRRRCTHVRGSVEVPVKQSRLDTRD
jgi:hypothetical protein